MLRTSMGFLDTVIPQIDGKVWITIELYSRDWLFHLWLGMTIPLIFLLPCYLSSLVVPQETEQKPPHFLGTTRLPSWGKICGTSTGWFSGKSIDITLKYEELRSNHVLKICFRTFQDWFVNHAFIWMDWIEFKRKPCFFTQRQELLFPRPGSGSILSVSCSKWDTAEKKGPNCKGYLTLNRSIQIL